MSRSMHLLSHFGAALLSRFATGLLASGLGGVLMICQWGHAAEPPTSPVPASLEMMQLLRDEHGLVANMVKVQLATERGELHSQRAASAGPDAPVGVHCVAAKQSPPNGTRSPNDLRVEACWRCEKPCGRLATIPSFNRPARAAVECCVLRGLFRGQTASRSFGLTAAENAEFGSQRPPTTVPFGVRRAARRAKSNGRWVQTPRMVFLGRGSLPPPRQPQAHSSPSGAWGSFSHVLFKDRHALVGPPGIRL
jgi:hypothetical protein